MPQCADLTGPSFSLRQRHPPAPGLGSGSPGSGRSSRARAARAESGADPGFLRAPLSPGFTAAKSEAETELAELPGPARGDRRFPLAESGGRSHSLHCLRCCCCREKTLPAVRSLLQQLDSIHVTVLHKEEGAGLGFSLAGGSDLENKVVTVSGPGKGPCVGDQRTPGRGAGTQGRVCGGVGSVCPSLWAARGPSRPAPTGKARCAGRQGPQCRAEPARDRLPSGGGGLECAALESPRNCPPLPSLWTNCLPRNWSPLPTRSGTRLAEDVGGPGGAAQAVTGVSAPPPSSPVSADLADGRPAPRGPRGAWEGRSRTGGCRLGSTHGGSRDGGHSRVHLGRGGPRAGAGDPAAGTRPSRRCAGAGTLRTSPAGCPGLRPQSLRPGVGETLGPLCPSLSRSLCGRRQREAGPVSGHGQPPSRRPSSRTRHSRLQPRRASRRDALRAEP